MCTCVCTHASVGTSTCMYTQVYACIQVRTQVYGHVCLGTQVCRTRVCMFTNTLHHNCHHMYLHTHVYTYASMHMHPSLGLASGDQHRLARMPLCLPWGLWVAWVDLYPLQPSPLANGPCCSVFSRPHKFVRWDRGLQNCSQRRAKTRHPITCAAAPTRPDSPLGLPAMSATLFQ